MQGMRTCSLDCECGNMQHRVRFFYDSEARSYIIESGVAKVPFFKRLKLAFRFLFIQEFFLQTCDVIVPDYDPQIKELQNFLDVTVRPYVKP